MEYMHIHSKKNVLSISHFRKFSLCHFTFTKTHSTLFSLTVRNPERIFIFRGGGLPGEKVRSENSVQYFFRSDPVDVLGTQSS